MPFPIVQTENKENVSVTATTMFDAWFHSDKQCWLSVKHISAPAGVTNTSTPRNSRVRIDNIALEEVGVLEEVDHIWRHRNTYKTAYRTIQALMTCDRDAYRVECAKADRYIVQ